MKLKWFYVREFQSVQDSGQINAGEIVCLVGKNEAGKSALLKALYRLNPIIPSAGKFDVTHDYPRMEVEDYRLDVEAKKREPATPIEACYTLDKDEIAEIEKLFGKECLHQPELKLSKSYESTTRTFVLPVNEEKALAYLIKSAQFPEPVREALKDVKNTSAELLKVLQAQEQTEEVKRIIGILTNLNTRKVNGYIFDKILAPKEPQYLYFDEYYQMAGHENINALIQREANPSQLRPSDHPMLGLIRLARLKLNDLLDPASTIELKNKLEGASNHLSKQVLKYWSQNKHLRMTFDVRPARPGDPEGMREGVNIWGGVFDNRHSVTTELGSRSRGFVWFFSFLAWYSDAKREAKPMILLLDEPGMTLHAKAQYDLLSYFETELKGNHQLIYSTHSPFMVDSHHFDRVRIVQDKSVDSEYDPADPNRGTKVLKDVFDASDDSLFPLQGAMGYDLHQTLFVGPNSLVVEGVADLLFMQAMSAILEEEGETGLDKRWTITPVGGASKVPTFVALLGAQKNLNIATLIDVQATDQQKIEALYKEKLLKKANVLTFADFTNTKEADIEDMFEPDFYVELVNAEFAKQLSAPIDLSKLKPKHPRITVRLEEHFAQNPLKSGSFGHYRPARYFSENAKALSKKLSKATKERFAKAFAEVNDLLGEEKKKAAAEVA